MKEFIIEYLFSPSFSNRFSASSVNEFQVTVNTLSINGGRGSIVRGVRKFVMHSQYNPDTMVRSYSPIPY